MNLRLQQKYLVPACMSLLLVACATFLYNSDNPLAQVIHERIEGIAYDLRLNFFLPEQPEPDPRVIIVDIDERSLRAIGHWPWPRSRVAQLVDALFQHQAAVVGMDIVFAEPELDHLEHLLQAAEELDKTLPISEAWQQVNNHASGDRRFAESLYGQPAVLGYSFLAGEEGSSGLLPTPLDIANTEQTQVLEIPEMPNFTANFPLLQQAADSAGFFFINADEDGVIRRSELLLKYNGNIYPSLALSVMHQYFGRPPVELIIEKEGEIPVLQGVSLGGMITIPTDNIGRTLIPFRGKEHSFHYLSALDILEGRISPSLIEGAIVLVGTTALGLYDLRATPVDATYPGVEVHANLILGMLDESFPKITSLTVGIDIAVLLGAGILFALLFPALSPFWLAVLTTLAAGSYVGASFWLWDTQGFVLSIALPTLTILTLGAGNATYGFLYERRGRQKLSGMFGQYVPPELVEKMSATPDGEYGFEGETRDMTVLFCDIRGFTSISENMSAQELKKMLNFFFTPMTHIIFDNNGTIDKYVGDMIMAFWGAPLENPKHHSQAVGAALAMIDQVGKMRAEIAAQGWQPINIGIGLNSGDMNVGDMGSEFRRAYTVLGDAVNLGSRLEGLTKYYGVAICVSETTKQGADDYLFRLLDTVRVKGKKESVAIYEPICLKSKADEQTMDEIKVYHRALDDYCRTRWNEAEEKFNLLREVNPNTKLYSIYLDRIRECRSQHLEENWDGVFTHTNK